MACYRSCSPLLHLLEKERTLQIVTKNRSRPNAMIQGERMSNSIDDTPGVSLPRAASAAWLPCLLLLLALVMGVIRLSSAPPLWWDEGWTLSVARTWVERGHYGRLLDGEPASARLAGGFPVIAPIALSFRLFGVGVWQGRIVGVGFTLGALALMYYLASCLYDRSVAVVTLAVLLFMSPHQALHPVLSGRQVLGEMPMLFYLLAGYVCFISALRRPRCWMWLVIVFWGIALRTKLQVLPFWTLSLLVPLGIMLLRQRWRLAGLIAIGLLGSLTASRLFMGLQHALLHDLMIPGSQIHGLYEVSALVPVLHVRFLALLLTLLLGLPTVLGLGYAVAACLSNRDQAVLNREVEVVRLALLTLAGGWLAWYVLMAIWWVRYLFPVTFIGSLFVAVMLRQLTDHFRLSTTLERGRHALRHLHLNKQNLGALLAIVLVSYTCSGTLRMVHEFYGVQADASVQQVADYLNTYTPPDALIEAYDAELFFLLHRRYHYPPDQISVELLRRVYLDQEVPVAYDPLAATPDYLVVGPFMRWWQLYAPVLETGAFRLRHVYGLYEVYERVY